MLYICVEYHTQFAPLNSDSGGGGGAGVGAPVTKLTKRIEELKTKLITKTDELNDALKSKSEV